MGAAKKQQGRTLCLGCRGELGRVRKMGRQPVRCSGCDSRREMIDLVQHVHFSFCTEPFVFLFAALARPFSIPADGG